MKNLVFDWKARLRGCTDKTFARYFVLCSLYLNIYNLKDLEWKVQLF
jgi:hypothetical protein